MLKLESPHNADNGHWKRIFKIINQDGIIVSYNFIFLINHYI